MRTSVKALALASAAALLLGGCSLPAGDEGSSPPTVRPTPEETTTAPSPSPPEDSDEPFTLVSQSLALPGDEWAWTAAGSGNTIVAVVERGTGKRIDVGTTVSTDGGLTWSDPTFVRQPGATLPRNALWQEEGVIIVGYTEGNEVDTYSPVIFAAPAPGYEPSVVELPEQFAGNVRLDDIVEVDGTWVIVGNVLTEREGPEGFRASTAAIWRSGDEGATWRRQLIEVDGIVDSFVQDLAIGPDGSWNLAGEAIMSGGRDFDALYLRSDDAGRTWQAPSQATLGGAGDQWACCVDVADDGRIALIGVDEGRDGASETSQIWMGDPGGELVDLADPRLTVEGGTPKGDFITTGMFVGEDLVLWGSPLQGQGVQFYVESDGELLLGYRLQQGDTRMWVNNIYDSGDVVIALGQIRPVGNNAEIAIWHGNVQ